MKIIFLLVTMMMCVAVRSQQKVAITETEKKALVDSIKKRLEQYYVFPDKAKEMGQYLVKRLRSKAYSSISDYNVLLDTIANDIDRVHHDPHLRIGYDPAYVRDIKERKLKPVPTAEKLEEEKAFYRKKNYGFASVEILPGNIGYLSMTEFCKVNEESEAVLASAFEFLAYTDVMILDIRNNSGGQPEMVREVLSYFFDKPVHTGSTYDRELDRTVDNYSLAEVKGRKIPNKPLYVLIGDNTFSAPEALAYSLKNLKRATIVGEPSAGAAHGEKGFIVNDQVVIQIPYMREVDPLTKTDWEGVGVQPDVTVKADKALDKAEEIILQDALGKATDPGERFALEWGLVSVRARLAPVTLTPALRSDYAGSYGNRKILLEDDELFFQRGNGPKRKLTALNENTFEVEGLDYYRLRFVRNGEGRVEKMIGFTNFNQTTEFLRTANTF